MSEANIKTILEESRTVAVVGLSPREERDSHRVAKYLQSQGYRIIPVNPNADEVLGERSYPDLASIPEPIDVVDVFRRSEAVPEVVEEAIQAGARTVWMQQGVIHEEAAARKAGLQVVMDRCTMVEHRRHFERGSAEGWKTWRREKGNESSHHRTDGCAKSSVGGGLGGRGLPTMRDRGRHRVGPAGPRTRRRPRPGHRPLGG